ncbi:MAG: ATP-binding cassette domain-containing protein [Moraxellaceae bacterium]|nr:MAG: ATP-binding cassette domain-containing protein [Moraxellaceae bacterium]
MTTDKDSVLHQQIDLLLQEAQHQKAQFENTTVKCGIIGLSGSGKSSLINAIAGQKIAQVGSTEQTMQAQAYLHHGIEFVDLPGCGTARWPQHSYIDDLALAQYDCFVMVTHTRLYEADLFLYQQITTVLNKPCFIVRNKIDIAIHDEAHDNQLTEAQTLQKVRDSLKAGFTDVLNDEFTGVLNHAGTHPAIHIYLTSARHPGQWDLPCLIDDIAASQQGIKHDRFVAGMAAWSDQALTAKRAVAYKIVSWSAVLSAANGLNPVPLLNISVDAGVLLNMCQQINQVYGLTEAQLQFAQSRQPHLSSTPEFEALKQNIAKWIARYTLTDGVLLALKNIGSSASLKNLSAFLPVVGQLFAAGLGYKLTLVFGEQYVSEAEEMARQVLHSMINREAAA